MNLRFLDPAEEEMTEAARMYEDQAVGLGERFLDEVEGCVDLLLDRPYIGRRVGQFWRFPLCKFPFALIYALEDADLVAVSHHRRRPGYWMGRYDR